MSKAQTSWVKAVRPPIGFEALYEGQPNSVPVAFPGTLDPLAGQPGYAPNLLAGIPVVLGARVFVQIPLIIDEYAPVQGYRYQFVWRVRNQASFNRAMEQGKTPSQFHLAGEGMGRREAPGLSTSGELHFIPGASDIELFEQEAPSGVAAAVVVARQQVYLPTMGQSWTAPIVPGVGSGSWQQGVYQYTSNVNCSGATFFPIWLDACGDELLILAYKPVGEDTWDFAGDDKGFSNTYGSNAGGLPNNPNIGILISTGTMGGG